VRLDHKKLIGDGGGNPTPATLNQPPDPNTNLKDYAIAEIKSGADMNVRAKRFLGGNAEGVTPVPIPNTEVKPLWADGTARVAVWESRSPPGILLKAPSLHSDGAFFVP
jgi:hypothetical protein